MTRQELYKLCAEEREKASQRHANSSKKCQQLDSWVAYNLWDELLGQLYKPKPVPKKQFQKTVDTALRMVVMISDPGYRKKQKLKIQNLTLL